MNKLILIKPKVDCFLLLSHLTLLTYPLDQTTDRRSFSLRATSFIFFFKHENLAILVVPIEWSILGSEGKDKARETDKSK